MSRLRRRKVTNTLATLVCLGLAGLALFPLFSVLSEVVQRGWHTLSWDFLSSVPRQEFVPDVGIVRTGGILHALAGTGLVALIGTVIGAPIGILAGIRLAEGPPSRFAAAARTCADAMAGIPSIVAGLFGYALVVSRFGYSAWAGGVALSILMIPTVTRTTEEALRTVAQEQREAALALGAPRWFTVVRVVMPAAWGAVTTGLLLGIARIAGETAPLLLTAGSGGTFLQTDPSQPVSTLPALIYDYGRSAQEPLQDQAWGAAMVLIGSVLLLNTAVRLFARRAIRRRA